MYTIYTLIVAGGVFLFQYNCENMYYFIILKSESALKLANIKKNINLYKKLHYNDIHIFLNPLNPKY